MSEAARGLILAPSAEHDRFIAGLRMSERARRVAVKSGLDPERVDVVRSTAELALVAAEVKVAIAAGSALVVVRATDQVVAEPALEPLDYAAVEAQIAVDEAGDEFAGVLCARGAEAEELLAGLADDLAADRGCAAAWRERGVTTVAVGARARHPAATREQARAADAWLFALVNKPLDELLVRTFYRPAAKPMVRLFLHTPISPNGVSVMSTAASLAGCAIAAQPSWLAHVLGLVLLIFGGVLDHCDGAVARLKMETSRSGAWLDAIGDDLERLALILAVGYHVAPVYPDWPVMWITAGAIAITLTAQLLIYWYCIFVIHSSSNQDYGLLLGIGPGTERPGRRSLWRWAADQSAVMARRIFIDLAVLGAALLSVPVASFVGLTVGAVVALGVVLPTHLKLVRQRRADRRAAIGPS